MGLLKWLIGGLALVGGCAWVLSRNKKPLSFDEFCNECTDEASFDANKMTEANIVKMIVVLTCSNGKDVVPYTYRKYADGSVKKKRIGTDTFPLDSCSNEVKESISKGEYIIKTFNTK